MKTQRKRRSPGPKTFRCAVYIREATDHEGGRKWNSLPRQREAIRAFIASRKRQGWVCLPDVYEDSGQSGATLQRPALQRLLADVEAGKVDCVVIHTVDRLSRCLSCHAKALALFRQHEPVEPDGQRHQLGDPRHPTHRHRLGGRRLTSTGRDRWPDANR